MNDAAGTQSPSLSNKKSLDNEWFEKKLKTMLDQRKGNSLTKRRKPKIVTLTEEHLQAAVNQYLHSMKLIDADEYVSEVGIESAFPFEFIIKKETND